MRFFEPGTCRPNIQSLAIISAALGLAAQGAQAATWVLNCGVFSDGNGETPRIDLRNTPASDQMCEEMGYNSEVEVKPDGLGM